MASAKPTYHHNASSAYALPADAPEHERLELQSRALITLMGGQPFHAPISTVPKFQKALDVGCGTGAMTVRIAQEHPDAKVYGVDLSPVPPVHERPANVEYVEGEISEIVRAGTQGFESGSFSYTFGRLLVFGMKNWPGYIRTIYSLLEPGGWAEMQEAELVWRDGEGEPVSNSWPWTQTLLSSVASKDMNGEIGGQLEQHLRDAGFVDVQVKQFMWSFSREHWEEHPETDEIGQFSAVYLRRDFRRILGGVLAKAGRSEEEVERWGQESHNDLDMPKGGHIRYFVVCGRKP